MKEFNPEEMDLAAQRAKDELEQLIGDGKIGSECAREFTDWFARHYLQAGHKRLGRVIVQLSKGGD